MTGIFKDGKLDEVNKVVEAGWTHLDVHQDAVNRSVRTTLELIEPFLPVASEEDLATFLGELSPKDGTVDLVVLEGARSVSDSVAFHASSESERRRTSQHKIVIPFKGASSPPLCPTVIFNPPTGPP